MPVRGRGQYRPGGRAAQAPGYLADPQRLRLEHHLPQSQAARRAGDPQVRFKPLYRVRRLPRVVVPADGADVRAVGVAEVHQVVVELGYVLAGAPRRQGPPGRDTAVQQHHRAGVVHPVKDLALADHLSGRRQPGELSAPARTGYDYRHTQRPVSGVVARWPAAHPRGGGGGTPCRPAPDEAAGDNAPARHAATAPAAATTTMPRTTRPLRPRETLSLTVSPPEARRARWAAGAGIRPPSRRAAPNAPGSGRSHGH